MLSYLGKLGTVPIDSMAGIQSVRALPAVSVMDTVYSLPLSSTSMLKECRYVSTGPGKGYQLYGPAIDCDGRLTKLRPYSYFLPY